MSLLQGTKLLWLICYGGVVGCHGGGPVGGGSSSLHHRSVGGGGVVDTRTMEMWWCWECMDEFVIVL